MGKFKIDRRRALISLFWTTPLLIAILVFGEVFDVVFSDNTVFTQTFTNIGVALFLAFANISFGWARSLDEKRLEYEIRLINRNGFYSIVTGILFMLTSLVTYAFNKSFATGIADDSNPLYILFRSGKFCLVVAALLLVILVLANFFNVAFKLFLKEYAIISKDGKNDVRSWEEELKQGKKL